MTTYTARRDTITSADGTAIHRRSWLPPDGMARASVVFVPGLGEWGDPYEFLGPAFLERSFALHVVDLLTVELERDPQFDQRHHFALPREDAIVRRPDRLEMTGADGGKADAARSVNVDHAPTGEITLEGARRLFFEVRPRCIGNRGKLAVKIIHTGFLL